MNITWYEQEVEGDLASQKKFDRTDIRLFSNDIEPTQVIRTILHNPRPEASCKIPRSLEANGIDIINSV